MYYLKRLLLTASLCCLNSANASDSSLENADLWLPKIYQEHMRELRSAAIAVKDTEKCHRLLSGKLIERRSSADHLVFSFRCRTQERSLFTVEFDNNTKVIRDPFASKMEESRLRKERLQAKRYSEICQQQMQQRIEEFNEPKILEDSQSASPMIKNGMTIYQLSFDSLSSKNKTLYYKVECRVTNDNDYQIKVSPRAKVMSPNK